MPLVLQCRDYLALSGYVSGVRVCGPYINQDTYSEDQGFAGDAEFTRRCSNERCVKLQVQVIYLIQEWVKDRDDNLATREGYATQLCESLNILLGKSGISDDEWDALRLLDYEIYHMRLQREIENGEFDWKYYNEYFDTLLGPSDDS